MWIWLLMLGCIIGIRFLIPDALGEKKKNLIFLSLTFLFITFFVGSRCPFWSGSADLYTYFACYKNAGRYPLEQLKELYRFETGYLIFNKILSWFFPWEYFIVYFEAAFCTGVILWYFNKHSKNVVMSVILYICVGPWSFFLTGFRQGFSICLCLIAFELMKKMSLGFDLIALALILLAYSFHTTAIVFVSVFFIRYMKMNKRTVFIALIITLMGVIFAKDILSWMNVVFDVDYKGLYIGNIFGGVVPIAIYTMALIFCYVLWKDNPASIDDMYYDILILFVGLCIYISRYSVVVFERISYYFTPVASVVLANSVSMQKNKVSRNIMVVMCIVLCTVLFMYRMSPQENYFFFWEYWERLIPIV